MAVEKKIPAHKALNSKGYADIPVGENEYFVIEYSVTGDTKDEVVRKLANLIELEKMGLGESK